VPSSLRDHAATSPVAPGDPSHETTHLVVSDRKGTVVSYTFTIESTGGNGIVVPGRGFLLNNELTDFNFDTPGHPNQPDSGKRPRSSMSPTIVLDRGRPFLAVGSPGGSMIITTVLQVLLERLDLGASLPEAIARPRASQRNTATTIPEPAFLASPEAAELASRYGHVYGTPAEIGASTGIEFLGGQHVLAAAEPVRRGGGSAMVEKPDEPH
jgi:gamma-glutamyltranspeptidase/glutathione hydrolase